MLVRIHQFGLKARALVFAEAKDCAMDAYGRDGLQQKNTDQDQAKHDQRRLLFPWHVHRFEQIAECAVQRSRIHQQANVWTYQSDSYQVEQRRSQEKEEQQGQLSTLFAEEVEDFREVSSHRCSIN
jgi:hypothetical protein